MLTRACPNGPTEWGSPDEGKRMVERLERRKEELGLHQQSKEVVVWGIPSVRCMQCWPVGFIHRGQDLAATWHFFLALLCPLQLLLPQTWTSSPSGCWPWSPPFRSLSPASSILMFDHQTHNSCKGIFLVPTSLFSTWICFPRRDSTHCFQVAQMPRFSAYEPGPTMLLNNTAPLPEASGLSRGRLGDLSPLTYHATCQASYLQFDRQHFAHCTVQSTSYL